MTTRRVMRNFLYIGEEAMVEQAPYLVTAVQGEGGRVEAVELQTRGTFTRLTPGEALELVRQLSHVFDEA